METASMGIVYADIELARDADLILVQGGYLQPIRILRGCF
jgi:hypothetical protein